MIASKFGIGQQVRHSLLGYLGVVVDIDPEYSLDQPSADELAVNDELRAAPRYHVVMEDDNGLPVHTYLAEAQLSSELQEEHPSNRRWMNWREQFENSFRPRACAIDANTGPMAIR